MKPLGRVVVVVGNPTPGSRTLRAAVAVGERVARILGLEKAPQALDLAALEPPIPGGVGQAAPAVAAVLSAEALVVASPTYKASYTGLTKVFLDNFDRDALGGTPTVPLMTGGSPQHALAVEVHLRPVLVEIGASCPTRGVYLSGNSIEEPNRMLDEWEVSAGPVLGRLARR